MISAAAANGWIDERAAALESLPASGGPAPTSSLTYWAADVANWLPDSSTAR